jgi:hypothetical protein
MKTALLFLLPFVQGPKAAQTLHHPIDVGERSLSQYVNGQAVTFANPSRIRQGDSQ